MPWIRFCPCALTRSRVQGEWTEATCGGMIDSEDFLNNPQYKIDTLASGGSGLVHATIRLQQRDISMTSEIGIYVFRLRKMSTVSRLVNRHEPPVAETNFQSPFDAVLELEIDSQFQYYVVPATKSRFVHASFVLSAAGNSLSFQLYESNAAIQMVRKN